MPKTTESPPKTASQDSLRQARHWVARHSAAAVGHGTAVLRQAVGAVGNLIFPPGCQLCGQEVDPPGEVHICAACRSQLSSRKPLCPACAMPLPNLASPATDSCPACRNQRFRFARVQTVGLYDGLLREAVLRMKKAHEEALTLTMGRLLAETLRFPDPTPSVGGPAPSAGDPTQPDLVVPVPMHWTRRIARGTNPPEVLAEIVADKLRVPAVLHLLRNHRKTRKQGTLLPDQRRRNVRQAFSISTGYDIKDTYVLLIDDVMTTGATGNELAKLLKRAGAKRVSVAVVARGTG